jgi:hypothetical protein
VHAAGFRAAVASLLLVAGCGGAGSVLVEPSAARGTDEVLTALAARFGPHERDAGFEAVRPKLARAALVPSRVYDDLELWTARQGDERSLELWGLREDGRYPMRVRPRPPAPHRVGDYRGTLRLGRAAPGRYEWRVRDELAVGRLSPTRVAAALTALFRAAPGSTEAGVRRSLRRDFPRASAAFGRLFRLDTVEIDTEPDGAAALRVRVSLHPDGLLPEKRRYAAFLRKYVLPTRFEAVAEDAGGVRWWEASLVEGRAVLSLRVHGGDLAPLEAAPRPIPAALRVRADYTTRAGPFRIGMRGILADVTLVREPSEKAFVARFTTAPDWSMPFLVEPFLRASLRHPFQGEGSQLAFSMRETAAGSTLLVRDYRVPVRESWIVRWLGGLTHTAVSEFRQGAEAESDRFSAECLGALREDLRALAARGLVEGEGTHRSDSR